MVTKIKQLCKEHSMNIKQLEIALNLGNGSVRRWDERIPSVDRVLLVAQYFGVSIEYLLGVETPPAVRDPFTIRYERLDVRGKAVVNAVLAAVETPTVIEYGTIRKYLARPAAGVGGLVEGEDYEDIPRTAETPRNADFALVVSGDSMSPYIKDGETIYVDEKAELKPMDAAVWCVDGATYVKQYCPMYNGDLMLLSANPKREDANITIYKDGNQNVQYFGKVILKKKLPQPIYER